MPFDSKAYYQKYYLEVSKINCVCEDIPVGNLGRADCFKTFATLQTLKRHQRTNQKCAIIKLKQQLKENEATKKIKPLSPNSECSTTYDMSSPSDTDFEQEPELKSYSVFNYLL